jgi:hypothetical protein
MAPTGIKSAEKSIDMKELLLMRRLFAEGRRMTSGAVLRNPYGSSGKSSPRAD